MKKVDGRIGEIFQHYRERAGLTKTDAERLTGVTRKTIGLMESGMDTALPLSAYATMAEVYNLPFAEFDMLRGISYADITGLTDEQKDLVCELIEVIKAKNAKRVQ